jgi:starch-binding outer membrane protein, SusD/RagB family
MNHRIWLAALGLALALSACESTLVETPASFLTTETYYRTAEELDRAALAGYASLRGGLSGGGGWNWALALSDDQGQSDPREPNAATLGPDFLSYTPTAPNNTNGGWAPMHATIYRANLLLARAPDVGMNDAQRTQLMAEAKFMRAYAYLWLDKLYSAGKSLNDLSVQLMLSEVDHAKQDLPRATVAEVHAAMIQDLIEAEAGLPANRPAAQRGRVTKGAAQMALADLYLWRSSFHLVNEWQEVADWSGKVISSGRYSLNRNFFATWLPSDKASNTESIFLLVMTGTAGRSVSGYAGTFFPRDLVRNEGGGFGVSKPTPWHLNSYATGDFRGTVGAESDTVAYRNHSCHRTAGCRSYLPHVWKFRPTNLHTGFGNVDVTLYRYAESLLMQAEALNELGRTAEAINHVNMVRARARQGTGNQTRVQPADLPTNMSRLQAREAIYMERNWELAHELKRWFDLVRRDSMEPGYWVNSLRSNDPNSIRLHPNIEQRQHVKRWPIPQREIDNDPAVIQNPGY